MIDNDVRRLFASYKNRRSNLNPAANAKPDTFEQNSTNPFRQGDNLIKSDFPISEPGLQYPVRDVFPELKFRPNYFKSDEIDFDDLRRRLRNLYSE